MTHHLLVIGGASTDILHTTSGTISSAGGAGMYTAMAAWRCGTPVSLFAPRPEPIPAALQPVVERLSSWLGPVVHPEELAHFEISYQDGHTTYLHASVGAEANLSPDNLPHDLSMYGCIHIIPLGSPQRQRDFVLACRQRGAKRISVGNHIDPIRSAPDAIHEILNDADICFMNEKEAIGLFGSLEQVYTQPGKLLFVTRGAKGCLVIQGTYVTQLDTQPTDPLDPTGAGDTFCGAVLSGIIKGAHPIMAARAAMPLASLMTLHFGPEALFWNEAPPNIPADARIAIDPAQVENVAQKIADLPEVHAFDFVGGDYPPTGHPAALDFFFASTLQQFGFWTEKGGRYYKPLIAPINGASQKGSSYLFQAYLRAALADPISLSPSRQAQMNVADLLKMYRADDDSDPMPAIELHLEQARRYGSDLLALDLNPKKIIQLSQASITPLDTFLRLLDQIGGYKEDPLRKKSSLLALILNQRPEGFLPFGETERVAPVIDYHLMRSCLRTGLLEILDQTLRKKLTGRQALAPVDEWAVRWAAYRAIEQVVTRSGKSMGAVDWFFFNARRRCPEMSEPVCTDCPVDSICKHYKELFQPILRTVFY